MTSGVKFMLLETNMGEIYASRKRFLNNKGRFRW